MAVLAQIGYTSSSNSSTNTVAATMSSAQSVGNCNVVFVQLTDTSITITVSDTKNGSYTQVGTALSTAGHANIACFVFPNIAAATAGSNVVTASLSNVTAFPEIIVEEWSGIVTSSVTDVSSSAKTTTNTGTGSVSVTTTNANDVVLTGFCNNGAGWTAAGSGFTLVKAATTTSGNIWDYKIVSSTGTYTDSPTSGGTNTEWAAFTVAIKQATGGTLNPSLTAGTVSVSGTVVPGLNPLKPVLFANVGITATPGSQLVYYPSLSGSISVIIAPPSPNPGGQPVTFNPVEPNVSGTLSVVGIATPILPNLFVSVSGNSNLTGVLTPAISRSVSGSLIFSGSLVPTYSPLFINVTGLISESGVIGPSFGPVTSGLISIGGSSVFPVGPGINNLQLGPILSGSTSVTGVVNVSLGPITSGLISVSGVVTPGLPTLLVTVSGTISETGVVVVGLDPSLGSSNPGFVGVPGVISPLILSGNVSVTGTLGLTGAVFTAPIFTANTSPINITSSFVPGISPAPFLGSVSVSGSATPTITPIFVTLAGAIIVSAVNDFDRHGHTIVGSLIGPYDFWGGGY